MSKIHVFATIRHLTKEIHPLSLFRHTIRQGSLRFITRRAKIADGFYSFKAHPATAWFRRFLFILSTKIITFPFVYHTKFINPLHTKYKVNRDDYKRRYKTFRENPENKYAVKTIDMTMEKGKKGAKAVYVRRKGIGRIALAVFSAGTSEVIFPAVKEGYQELKDQYRD